VCSVCLCVPLGRLHSSPTRRSSDLILKVEIGVGQRNDVNTGVSHLGNERCGLILVAQRQRATVARNNATFEASAQNALCDQLKRSEEHTSELQSRENLVCRLLLEKK